MSTAVNHTTYTQKPAHMLRDDSPSSTAGEPTADRTAGRHEGLSLSQADDPTTGGAGPKLLYVIKRARRKAGPHSRAYRPTAPTCTPSAQSQQREV